MSNLFHTLQGKNIYFKPLSINDAQEIHSFASDEDVSRFIGWQLMSSLKKTVEHIEGMLKQEAEGTYLYASIVLKQNNAIIGTAMIFNFNKESNHAEIGYVLNKDYWGRGYGTEIVNLLNSFVFYTLNLHKIHANIVDANIGSMRVLENNGYVLEGRLKDYYFIDGRYFDRLIFGRLNPNKLS